MTADQFRSLALELPEAVESSHMDHPDFRVHRKIFATLGYPDAGYGMVKLTPEEQARLVRSQPAVFVPVNGGWGLRGATYVRLEAASEETLRHALATAWRNVAPKRLREKTDENS